MSRFSPFFHQLIEGAEDGGRCKRRKITKDIEAKDDEDDDDDGGDDGEGGFSDRDSLIGPLPATPDPLLKDAVGGGGGGGGGVTKHTGQHQTKALHSYENPTAQISAYYSMSPLEDNNVDDDNAAVDDDDKKRSKETKFGAAATTTASATMIPATAEAVKRNNLRNKLMNGGETDARIIKDNYDDLGYETINGEFCHDGGVR